VSGGSRETGHSLTEAAPVSEASLAAEVERVARALEEPGTAVIATDPAGRILFWSDGACALYGWSRDEVLGRDVVEVTPSELSQAEAAGIMRTLREGAIWSGRFIVRDKQGRRFLAEVKDVPIRDDRGDLIGMVGTSRRSQYIGR
jgi:PAS domain S-box-containing protein